MYDVRWLYNIKIVYIAYGFNLNMMMVSEALPDLNGACLTFN